MDGDEKDRDRSMNRQSWDEYVRSAPSITAKLEFEAAEVAEELIEVMKDKKRKKEAKKLLIQTLTQISNRQRQELKKEFLERHPGGLELTKATTETLKKGKTMTAMLALMQRPSHFNAFWVEQAIKKREMPLLVEILCSCTNYEIKKMRDFYEKQPNNGDLIEDIEKHIVGNKKTARFLVKQLVEGSRPETTTPDKKLCKYHLQEMGKLLQNSKRDQKRCKSFFAKLFVENSYPQVCWWSCHDLKCYIKMFENL